MNGKTFSLFLLMASSVLSAGIPVSGNQTPEKKSPAGEGIANRQKRGPFPGRVRRSNVFFAKFTPEEHAKIKTLVQAGKREELRKYMGTLIHKYRPEEMKKLDELSLRYQAAKTEKDKTAIKEEMRKLAAALFRKRQEFTHNNILHTERQLLKAKQELERLKQRYENSQKNQTEIIERHVENMCLPPEQRKRWHHRLNRKNQPEKDLQKQK